MADNIEEIGKVIKDMLKEYKLEDKYLQANIHNAWREVAGEYIFKFTTKIKFSNGCLYLYINSSAVKNELQYSKSVIIEKMNIELQSHVIKQIKIY